jgi:prephenate dehydratase
MIPKDLVFVTFFMTLLIAHLGPSGTNAETAALVVTEYLKQSVNLSINLRPYASIALSLTAVAQGQAELAVVPVENSIEGSVAMTLDTLWQLDTLKIRWALDLPITHALLSCAESLDAIATVYSHPQALGQCQVWLEQNLPKAQLLSSNSTTEPLQWLVADPTLAAISAPRAAELYGLPILMCPINDRPDNCTRFWVITTQQAPSCLQLLQPKLGKTQTSMAFSLPDNVPGALLNPLQILAQQGINMSRIESRPTKKSLGDYLFFVDIEADAQTAEVQTTLAKLATHAETLKLFGSYEILRI